MRLTRLDLDRYGPFTSTVLELRPDAALHIIHGPNEAGKSSALAAITDLLYGFEPRSPANFRHRYEDLKIGAQVLRADGSNLAFWRRKRLRNSLSDGADTPPRMRRNVSSSSRGGEQRGRSSTAPSMAA